MRERNIQEHCGWVEELDLRIPAHHWLLILLTPFICHLFQVREKMLYSLIIHVSTSSCVS